MPATRPISVLAPGTGKTQTARPWTNARHHRVAPGRLISLFRLPKGPSKDHPHKFRGWMHADSYAGFEDLYRSGAIHDIASLTQVRRKFVDTNRSQGTPIVHYELTRMNA